MTEPIKLPPLPEPWNFTRPTVVAYARLAVEQATADLAAEATNLMYECADLRARAEKAEAERDASRAELASANRECEIRNERELGYLARAQTAEAELARLTTLRPSHQYDAKWLVQWWIKGRDGKWRPADLLRGTHWTPLPDVKEAKP
jgi:hypothetical protein